MPRSQRLSKRYTSEPVQRYDVDHRDMQFIDLEYSCGPEVTKHQIHTGLIRGPLTRNLGILFGDVLEEIRAGFAETVDVQLGDNRKFP